MLVVVELELGWTLDGEEWSFVIVQLVVLHELPVYVTSNALKYKRCPRDGSKLRR